MIYNHRFLLTTVRPLRRELFRAAYFCLDMSARTLQSCILSWLRAVEARCFTIFEHTDVHTQHILLQPQLFKYVTIE